MTDQPNLRHLEGVAPFETRHVGPGPEQQAKMLATLGYGSLDDLTSPVAIVALVVFGLSGLIGAELGRRALRRSRATQRSV